jgi:hypothetical protein
MNRYHIAAGSRQSVSTRNERNASTRYSGTTMGAPMPSSSSGVMTKITTPAAVVVRNEAYQGLLLGLEFGPPIGGRVVVAACCSVIVHLTRFMTDDGVARPARGGSAAEHRLAVPFGTHPRWSGAMLRLHDPRRGRPTWTTAVVMTAWPPPGLQDTS